MNNIILERIWQEENLLKLKVFARSHFVAAYQFCNVSVEQLEELSNIIGSYSHCSADMYYWETGAKTGKSSPTLSMKILPAKKTGHVFIELDMEIEDNRDRMHRCMFYVETELGALERFGKSLACLVQGECGTSIRLYEE